MKRSLIVSRSLVAITASLALSAQAPSQTFNPLIGTWKQNMEKSTYVPGPAPLKGMQYFRQYAAGDDGSIVAITLNIDPEGRPSLGALSAANYDGREYAQHTVATLATSLGSHISPRIERTISYTPVNTYSVDIVQRQNGEVISKSTRTISRDGKTMTDKTDFVDSNGIHIANVLVFERQ
jgi:hypothetical protein